MRPPPSDADDAASTNAPPLCISFPQTHRSSTARSTRRRFLAPERARPRTSRPFEDTRRAHRARRRHLSRRSAANTTAPNTPAACRTRARRDADARATASTRSRSDTKGAPIFPRARRARRSPRACTFESAHRSTSRDHVSSRRSPSRHRATRLRARCRADF